MVTPEHDQARPGRPYRTGEVLAAAIDWVGLRGEQGPEPDEIATLDPADRAVVLDHTRELAAAIHELAERAARHGREAQQ